jgi:hypothetical protein
MYPFAPAHELAEAAMIAALASSHALSPPMFARAWKLMRAIPCDEFRTPYTSTFVQEYERLLDEYDQHNKERFLTEYRDWSTRLTLTTTYTAEILPESHPLVQGLLEHHPKTKARDGSEP